MISNTSLKKNDIQHKNILFRDAVNIPSTTYATHGLYMYPAKFIPHVVRFVIDKYTSEKDWIFDPFAGYGTVGIEGTLTNRNYMLRDLNPLLNSFIKASTFRDSIKFTDININFDYNDDVFLPKWKNIDYWHPPEFLNILSKLWGYYHNEISEDIKPVVAIPLLKITRYFSYSDEKISKLYKSKYAKKKVEYLLSKNYRRLMEDMYKKESKKTLQKIEEYQRYNPKNVKGIVEGNTNSLYKNLDIEVDTLITSPPYLQAQEYIRSIKLELFWMGYDEKTIRELSKQEIPYCKTPKVDIHSETYLKYYDIVEELEHKKLLQIYECYFKSLLKLFNNIESNINNTFAVFVSPVKIRNVKIPIDEIIKEHMENLGWKHEITYIDKIVSRRLFNVKKNPATGLTDERTKYEHLIIMKR